MRLLAGPTNARERIFDFLEKSRISIDIYAPSFSDAELIQKIHSICLTGKVVRVLLADYDEEI
ncbi:hypothetical protein H6768_01495 [Candidatus Peribacteria bacterium]|nr:hypothetical protein [Candidatus Peribacteria bacterium]